MTWLDVMTLLIILVVVVVNVWFVIWLAGLPGRLARDRAHPQSEAISVLGWLSLVTFFATWPFALVWAYVLPANLRLLPSATKPEVLRETEGVPR